MSKLTLSCTCQKMTLEVPDYRAKKEGGRMVCYCDDCQTFVNALGRDEEPNDVLSAEGGLTVMQFSPPKVKITKGKEHLACLRLSPKGAMRFYASCCNTPLVNTLLSPNMAFLGLVIPQSASERTTIEAQSHLRAHIQCQDARAQPTGDKVFQTMPKSFMAKFMVTWAGRRIAGAHKRSDFSGKKHSIPVVEPKVLSKSERSKFREEVRAKIPRFSKAA